VGTVSLPGLGPRRGAPTKLLLPIRRVVGHTAPAAWRASGSVRAAAHRAWLDVEADWISRAAHGKRVGRLRRWLATNRSPVRWEQAGRVVELARIYPYRNRALQRVTLDDGEVAYLTPLGVFMPTPYGILRAESVLRVRAAVATLESG
jgi:hypothetical protein